MIRIAGSDLFTLFALCDGGIPRCYFTLFSHHRYIRGSATACLVAAGLHRKTYFSRACA